MDKRNCLDKLKIEDLPEQYKIYASLMGIENLIRLAKKFGGTQIYIPKADELAREYKYKKIREKYDGGNVKELATMYDYSESTVYRIVRDQVDIIKNKPFDNQISIFD